MGTMGENFKEQFTLGYKARKEGRAADARAVFFKAVRTAAEEGDRPSLAEALCGLGQSERDIGNLEASGHHYANAVILYRQIGPPERLAYALRHEAEVRREECQPAASETLYLEAETLYRQLGDDAKLDLANTLRGLALVTPHASKARWSEARALYAEQNIDAGVAECDKQLSTA